LREFAVADYRDVKPVAPKLPAEVLAKWLENPELASARGRLYATLLGDCGNETHAALLKKKIDDPTTQGLEGLLVGYFLLKPKEGAGLLKRIVEDRRQEFFRRYSALAAVRFLGTFRQERLDKKQWMELTSAVLKQPDMADFAISDFRH